MLNPAAVTYCSAARIDSTAQNAPSVGGYYTEDPEAIVIVPKLGDSEREGYPRFMVGVGDLELVEDVAADFERSMMVRELKRNRDVMPKGFPRKTGLTHFIH